MKALISSAEVLTPDMRSTIEGAFGVPVLDRYGNREFGAIAAEDGKGGLVVNPADMILETNEQGELLITYVDRIPTLSSGKRKFTVSRVENPL